MESLHLGSNIKVVDWAPQNDILGHPSVKAFVTHAGSNGLYEAAYHGKPVVSVPLMNEQPDNAAKVSHHLAVWQLVSNKPCMPQLYVDSQHDDVMRGSYCLGEVPAYMAARQVLYRGALACSVSIIRLGTL